MTNRNTPERKLELDKRRMEQRNRIPNRASVGNGKYISAGVNRNVPMENR